MLRRPLVDELLQEVGRERMERRVDILRPSAAQCRTAVGRGMNEGEVNQQSEGEVLPVHFRSSVPSRTRPSEIMR